MVSNGAPWVKLSDGSLVTSEYQGDAQASAALRNNAASPLSLVTADFNEDGVPDLVGGYSLAGGGGAIAVWLGNVDARYPNAPTAQQRKQAGTFSTAPFLSPALVYKSPVAPGFLFAGDFDNSGDLDIVAAQQGGNQFYVLPGNGAAGFGVSKIVSLPGQITDLVVGDVNRRDGLADIAVALDSPNGAHLLVYEHPKGAINAAPESILLPAVAEDLAIGHLNTGAFPEVAVVMKGANSLLIVHGRDRQLSVSEKLSAAPRLEQRQLDFTPRSVAIGDYIGNARNDVALLGTDGAVRLISNQSAVGQTGAVEALENWNLKKLAAAPLIGATHLLSSYVSSLPYESLFVVNPEGSFQALTVGENGKDPVQNAPALASASFAVERGGTAALLPMKLNADQVNDLVVLHKGDVSLSVLMSLSATFTVINTNTNGPGSLAQAIIDANNNPGADTIAFAIGAGPQTITLTDNLPETRDTVTIDGTTQPGYAGTPIIEINGAGALSGYGIKLSLAPGSLVRGLVMNGFIVTAIESLSANSAVENCYLGTNAAGMVAAPNGDGVQVNGVKENVVGGTVAAARNLLSGNTESGVSIVGVGADDNLVQGNYIGTDVTGASALPNTDGVWMPASNNTIGGTVAGAGNIISGNTGKGIYILEDLAATGNIIQGNYIGTNAAGTVAVANGEGIFIFQVPLHTIGGTAMGAGNLIAGNAGHALQIVEDGSIGNIVQGNTIGTMTMPNTGDGVRITKAANNTIGGLVPSARNTISFNNKGIVVTDSEAIGNQLRQNSIFLNTGLGIDLADNGVTANDAGDGDTGPNNLQNYPVITFASGGATTVFIGTLNSLPNQDFTIEFFINSACDPSGNGEGETYFDALVVTTDATGNAAFNVTFPTPTVAGNFVTATATNNTTFDTSEFSACRVICVYTLSATLINFPDTGGPGSVTVTSGTGCDWTAVSNAPWIVITSGASGSGNGTVNFTVAPNFGIARTGTLTIANQTVTINQAAASNPGADTAGLYDPANAAFFLRNSNTGGIADVLFTYGPANLGWVPIVGDWNGDGVDTIGLYDPANAAFFLRNSNTGGIADILFTYGPAGLGWIPIIGDWNGDGVDTIGLYAPSGAGFFLRNSNTGGIADVLFTYGPAGLGWVPIIGDWNGDIVDTIGLYDPANAAFFLRNSNTGGIADITFTYGPAGIGWKPIMGDWDGL